MRKVRCFLTILVVLAYSKTVSCVQGEPVVYFPPFELRAVRPVGNRNIQNAHIQAVPAEINHRTIETEEAIPTTVPVQPASPIPQVESHEKPKNDTISVHNLLKALGINEEEKNKPNDQKRAASGRDYEYPPYLQPPSEYGYPSRGYWPPSQYQDNSYAYVPPTYGQHLSPPVPKNQFLNHVPERTTESHGVEKSLSSKVAGKVSGIIGLVMALLTGSTPDDFEIKGVKDLVINGIVKPLMLAKGGIKSLISKLSIPLIVLLLVNLELLILIWWLWEDCQVKTTTTHHTVNPIYPYERPAPVYGYNPPAYNPYR